MKLVLDILNGIVIRVQRLDETVIENVTDKSPYCKSDDLGNGYAVSLRRSDLYNGRTQNFLVKVLPDGDPLEYLRKRYDAAKDQFVSSFDRDEDRVADVVVRQAGYRIDSEGKNLYPSPEQQTELINIFGKSFIDQAMEKILNYQILNAGELNIVEDKLSQLSEPTRLMVVNQIANSLTGSDVLSHTDLAIYWWDKLVKTSLEKRGLSAIAGIYALMGRYDESAGIYEDMLKRSDLVAGQADEIKEKLYAIGKGNAVFDSAKASCEAAAQLLDSVLAVLREKIDALQKIDPNDEAALEKINDEYNARISDLMKQGSGICDGALNALQQFEGVATGRSAFFLGARAQDLEARVRSLKGKFDGDIEQIKKAADLLKNPKRYNETL